MKKTLSILAVILCIVAISCVFAACTDSDAEECLHKMTAIPATGATCTEDGNNQYYYCAECGKYFTDTEGTTETTPTEQAIPATGHSFTEYVSDNNATCTEDGTETATCDNCTATDTRTDVGSATGHDWNSGEVTTAATCTEDGVKTYTCLNCGDTRTEAISASGHSFTEYVSDNNATCTEDGTETATCDNCTATDTRTDVGSATGHDWNSGEVTTAATCTEDGVKTYTCLNCGDTRTETIPATGHNYINGECTICGAIDPGYEEEEVYVRVDEDGNESVTGEYILFGSYPQTKVTDTSIISALGEFDESTWTSYGYYIEGEVSDYMYYIDKEYNGERYRGVYFTSYRPYGTTDSGSASDTNQDDNGYITSTVYWFKYEPIKWLIVEESDGTATLVADLILDSQQFDFEADKEMYGNNNYAESSIRAWLNETFYNTAFSEGQKGIIQTTVVDNSAASTGYDENPYACEDTSDKVFLLSYEEVDAWFTTFAKKKHQGSDYAKSQGLYVLSGIGSWWLRSPIHNGDENAKTIRYNGFDGFNDLTYSTDNGVLPALAIRL